MLKGREKSDTYLTLVQSATEHRESRKAENHMKIVTFQPHGDLSLERICVHKHLN